MKLFLFLLAFVFVLSQGLCVYGCVKFFLFLLLLFEDKDEESLLSPFENRSTTIRLLDVFVCGYSS